MNTEAFQYVAYVRKEGRSYLIEFPDAPGCQTFADKKADIAPTAREALEGWLEAHLVDGRVAPVPRVHRARQGEERIHVGISPKLAVAVQIRAMRSERGWTQAELAKRVGVSQQQIAKVENPDANPTIETVTKIADALERPLVVTFSKSA
jgi:DNA-binding XRE family transcriptional regulator/predicted RNase H-like HicB family nuclease